MKNKGAKQKLKRKGAAAGAFGCDLTEHLESSGQDGEVPPGLARPPPSPPSPPSEPGFAFCSRETRTPLGRVRRTSQVRACQAWGLRACFFLSF